MTLFNWFPPPPILRKFYKAPLNVERLWFCSTCFIHYKEFYKAIAITLISSSCLPTSNGKRGTKLGFWEGEGGGQGQDGDGHLPHICLIKWLSCWNSMKPETCQQLQITFQTPINLGRTSTYSLSISRTFLAQFGLVLGHCHIEPGLVFLPKLNQLLTSCSQPWRLSRKSSVDISIFSTV